MKFAFSFKALSFRAEEFHESRYMPCDTVRAVSDHAEVRIIDGRRREGSEMEEMSAREAVGRSDILNFRLQADVQGILNKESLNEVQSQGVRQAVLDEKMISTKVRSRQTRGEEGCFGKSVVVVVVVVVVVMVVVVT